MFRKALADIYQAGGWCTVWDDFWYLTVLLGLEKDAKKFLYNARSNDIPFVLGAQRPAGNRLVEIFDQADHILFFRDNDEANLRRIGGVGWLSSDLIRGHVANLDPYQFLYVQYQVRAHVPVYGAGAHLARSCGCGSDVIVFGHTGCDAAPPAKGRCDVCGFWLEGRTPCLRCDPPLLRGTGPVMLAAGA